MPSPARRPRTAPKAYASKPRPQQSPTSTKHVEATKRIPYLRQRRVPLILSSVAGAGIAWYSYLVVRGYRNDARISADLDVPADTSERYNFTASRFDDDVSGMEWLTGIEKRRKELCAKASGHVLEISAGTGRNSKYLPLLKGVKSVTLVDKSREMIDEARRKWPEEGNAWFVRAKFRVQDCRERVPSPRPEGFDTVIQTMGLCSTGEPEALLRNMGEMTNQDGGKILLLEHGKGYYDWLNNLLDSVAPVHAQRHGCWFNKDIGGIVERSGLEIVEQRRYNFGTTWWFELKPKKQAVAIESTESATQQQPNQTSWTAWLGLRGV